MFVDESDFIGICFSAEYCQKRHKLFHPIHLFYPCAASHSFRAQRRNRQFRAIGKNRAPSELERSGGDARSMPFVNAKTIPRSVAPTERHITGVMCSDAAYLWLTQIWEKVALGAPTFANARPLRVGYGGIAPPIYSFLQSAFPTLLRLSRQRQPRL